MSSSVVADKKSFIDALENKKPDIILSDYKIPGYSGLEALELTKTKYPNTPFIILSGALGEEKAVNLIKAGAWDFVSKDNLSRLHPSLNLCLKEVEERKKLNEARKRVVEYQQRLDLAVRGAELGIWEWECQSGDFDYNERFAEMLDFGYDEMRQLLYHIPNKMEAWQRIIHKDELNDSVQAIHAHIEGETSVYNRTHRVPIKDGSWKWVLDRGQVVSWDHQGKAIRMLGIRIDLNEQKQVEAAYAESSRKFKDLIENLPGAVFQKTKDQVFNFLSYAWKDITGYDADQFVANKTSFAEIMNENDVAPSQKEITIAIGEKRNYQTQYRVYNKNGEEKWILEQGKPIFDSKGKLRILEGFIYDVTDRIKAEQNRIAAVINTEDNERGRIAKELHDGLGQFLNAAFLNFEIVGKEQDSLSKKAQEKFGTGKKFLKTAIEESRAISHNLMPKAIGDFGYAQTIESILDGLEGVTTVNFNFYHNLSDRLDKEIELSLFRITQEAINNILKHSEATEATIQLMKYDDVAILTIEDDGKGFNRNKLKHNFGLTSMKNRTNAISGIFSIDSRLNTGTTITVEIPLN